MRDNIVHYRLSILERVFSVTKNKSGRTSTLPVSPMVKTEVTEESEDKDSLVES